MPGQSGWYPGRCKDCAAPGASCGECKACRKGRTCESPRGRCAEHAQAHNQRERERRAERKAAGRCTVCGERAVKVEGVFLNTCQRHREYFAARARGEG